MTLVNPDLPSARNVLATYRIPLVVIRIKVCHSFSFCMASAKSPPSNFLSFKKVKILWLIFIHQIIFLIMESNSIISGKDISSELYVTYKISGVWFFLVFFFFWSILCSAVFGKKLIFFTHSYIFLFICYLILYPSCLLWWKTFLRKWFA